MAPKIHQNQHPTQSRLKKGTLVYEVVRPQKKHVSRYKLKKQSNIANDILNDPQIMGG